MAVAGKVAITLSTENGGAWSADVTYDRLVAVKHNNNLYISRKTVANVEPPNDEFWFLALEGFGGEDVEALIDRLNELSDLIQAVINGTTQVGNAKTLDGHGAEYFFPKGGGEVNGNVVVDKKATSAAETLVKVVNTLGGVGLIISDGGNHGIWSNVHNKWLLKSELNGYTVVDAVASGNLPLTGGTVTKNGTKVMGINNTNSVYTLFEFYGQGAELGSIGFDGVNNLIFRQVEGGTKKLLHTGNKPTGTYTGNGSATGRTIAVGGIGNCLMVRRVSSEDFAIVTESGYIGKKGGTVVCGADAYYSRGGQHLYTATVSELFNSNGGSYYYELL